MFGPLQDFMGQTLLLQFVAKHPPTDADWEEKWPQEHEQLRDRTLASFTGSPPCTLGP